MQDFNDWFILSYRDWAKEVTKETNDDFFERRTPMIHAISFGKNERFGTHQRREEEARSWEMKYNTQAMEYMSVAIASNINGEEVDPDGAMIALSAEQLLGGPFFPTRACLAADAVYDPNELPFQPHFYNRRGHRTFLMGRPDKGRCFIMSDLSKASSLFEDREDIYQPAPKPAQSRGARPPKRQRRRDPLDMEDTDSDHESELQSVVGGSDDDEDDNRRPTSWGDDGITRDFPEDTVRTQPEDDDPFSAFRAQTGRQRTRDGFALDLYPLCNLGRYGSLQCKRHPDAYHKAFVTINDKVALTGDDGRKLRAFVPRHYQLYCVVSHVYAGHGDDAVVGGAAVSSVMGASGRILNGNTRKRWERNRDRLLRDDLPNVRFQKKFEEPVEQGLRSEAFIEIHFDRLREDKRDAKYVHSHFAFSPCV
jgi:hypothetical protein